MAMSAAQVTGFNNASGTTVSQFHTGITLVIGSFIILWLVWVTFGLFKAWRRRDIDLYDFTWGVIRGTIVMLLITWFIR